MTLPDTAPVRTGEQLNLAALEGYLRRHLPELCLPMEEREKAPIEIEQFPGGHSNLTYLIRFGSREFVLRRPPFGPVAPTAHDMPREFRILSLVHPVFPMAPKPDFLCEDTVVLGAPFYLMERRRGIVVRREIPSQIGDDLELRRQVSESLIDTLADLHAVDIGASGIHRIGKPEGFLERQIIGWKGRWERAKTSETPAIEAVTQWLIERIPDPQGATLVHNDFKLDNVMLDSENPSRVVAVLDWEMCTVGDPLVDLGILLCYWPEQDDPEARRESISAVTTLPGWMKREELVDRYAGCTGRDVSMIHYYEAFAIFKVAVVVQQIYYRYHQGQTRDERFADFGRRATGLLDVAWEVSQKL
jgi:aminoglycoside phosphotransferase (APT) family kinase protein